MLSICSLIQKFFGFIKTVSKKTYRTGVVVMSGAVLFAIVAMNSGSFSGAGKNQSSGFVEGNGQESVSEEDSDMNESEPVASLTALADREHVGNSSVSGEYSGNIVNQNTEMKNSISKMVSEQTDNISELTENVPESESVTEITTEVATEEITEVTTELPTEMEAETQVVTEEVTEAEAEAGTETYNPVDFGISDDDYYWLIRIVEAEAGDQDEIGRILVTNVIFNRVRSESFPESVKSVIFQNNGRVYQFEPVKNERIYDVTPSQTTIDCVGRAMAGEDYSSGALYFTMQTSSRSWFNQELNLLFVHGDHYFYGY